MVLLVRRIVYTKLEFINQPYLRRVYLQVVSTAEASVQWKEKQDVRCPSQNAERSEPIRDNAMRCD
jgi:hypothetical protein